MRLKIVQAGEPVLRQTARSLTREEITGDEIQRLIQDMKETMRDAPGVGLAAPQVGLPLQLAVIEDREDLWKGLPPQEFAEKERRPVLFHVIINPDITFSMDDTGDFYEGYLSLAGFSAVVPRARTVRAKYLDKHGGISRLRPPGGTPESSSMRFDHLSGTLYIDRMHSRTFTSLGNWNRFWKEKPMRAVLNDLSRV